MTIIFDYDGTLHDTAKLYGTAFRRAYKILVQRGLAANRYYSDREMSKYLGINAGDMWKMFMPSLPDAYAREISRIVGEYMVKGTWQGYASLYSGATDTLERLLACGCRMVLLSNCQNNYMNAHRNYFSLDRYFEAFYTAEAEHYEPKEKIIPKIRRHFPDDTYIMVGDRDSDIRAAKVNRLLSVGCSYGYGTAGELSGCTAIAHSVQEIPSAIGRAVGKPIF